jgi:transposase
MDILDRHNKHGLYIVMDNCRIHHSVFAVDAINKKDYRPLFMPPYSSFLNLIGERWFTVKKSIKRNTLEKYDRLSDRI